MSEQAKPSPLETLGVYLCRCRRCRRSRYLADPVSARRAVFCLDRRRLSRCRFEHHRRQSQRLRHRCRGAARTSRSARGNSSPASIRATTKPPLPPPRRIARRPRRPSPTIRRSSPFNRRKSPPRRPTLQGEQARLSFAAANQHRYATLSATGASTIQNTEQANTDLATAQALLAADQANLLAAHRQVDVLNAALAQAEASLAQANAHARPGCAQSQPYPNPRPVRRRRRQ